MIELGREARVQSVGSRSWKRLWLRPYTTVFKGQIVSISRESNGGTEVRVREDREPLWSAIARRETPPTDLRTPTGWHQIYPVGFTIGLAAILIAPGFGSWPAFIFGLVFATVCGVLWKRDVHSV